ncbi:putative non-specific serine/threonine protein kinase [Rosa chinensis]|uniref:Putative non-specific serine/threonine protein kinase n=1 Tax=Rosa chinensis TaxID=74649 RepID=A0A2P6S2M1_ROSCH|nr:putative non-specific serine/threonine protein kinase [Rosa chinensis]
MSPTNIFNYNHVTNENESYFTYSVYYPNEVSRLVMYFLRQVWQLTWKTNKWNLLSDPYWIPFGEDEYAQVTEVCKVLVSMGKFYKEEITCHVIDMDDTNVLFGRPWHEKVKGGYCKDNTYLFRWESHKIKIKPRRKIVKNDHPEVCQKEHEEATLKIEEKLIKVKEADSFITSISMSCMSNCVQDQPKEKSLPIPFQVEEFKFQDAYSKLVYGIRFMVIPFNFENIEVDSLSCVFPSNDRAAYKRNSRSSSFQVEETDVGQDFSQLQQRISKRKKHLHITKNDLNIENWYSNRLLNDGINHKLLFWIYQDSRSKSWLGFQIYVCLFLVDRKKTTRKRRKCQRKQGEIISNIGGKNDTELPVFDLKSILAATEDFSAANKLDERGFGPVYKVFEPKSIFGKIL